MAARAKKSPKGRSARAARGGLAAIVLAAGKGTRMRSARAKVLHEILGRPLGAYPIDLAREMGADPVFDSLRSKDGSVRWREARASARKPQTR